MESIKEKEQISFWGIIYVISMMLLCCALIYMSWLGLKDWQDTKALIRENNGSCYREGWNLVCSYTEPVKSMVTTSSTSECYIDKVEVDCTEDFLK